MPQFPLPWPRCPDHLALAVVLSLWLGTGHADADPPGSIWRGLSSGDFRMQGASAGWAEADRLGVRALREAETSVRRGLFFRPATGLRLGLTARPDRRNGFGGMVALELDF